jgi:hypothetical protein
MKQLLDMSARKVYAFSTRSNLCRSTNFTTYSPSLNIADSPRSAIFATVVAKRRILCSFKIHQMLKKTGVWSRVIKDDH